MKKVSTVAAKSSKKISQQKLAIGLDLGDRSSCYCLLDEVGEVRLEQRVSTTPKAMQAAFGKMPRRRIALETGMHSPWVSRLLAELGHEVIVAQASNVRLIGETRKKSGSAKSISNASELLERLRSWKQWSEFPAESDWVFASPISIGRKPYSYTNVRQVLERAADAAGLSKFGTHTFRHSFRTWLGASGVPVELQRELMRHSTITMPLKYGETFDPGSEGR